jgi:hypothetical protein
MMGGKFKAALAIGVVGAANVFGYASAQTVTADSSTPISNAILSGSIRISLSIIFAAALIKFFDVWFQNRKEAILLKDDLKDAEAALRRLETALNSEDFRGNYSSIGANNG